MNKDEVLTHYLYPISSKLHYDIPNRKPSLRISYPKLKIISKEIIKQDPIEFLESNDSSIYELEILETYVISYLKDINLAIHYFNRKVYQAKEWSVVDSLCQKFVIAKKYPDEVFKYLQEYAKVDDEYVQRVVSVMLLSHFNKDEMIEQSLRLIQTLNHPGYFNKMGIAWALATFLINYPNQVLSILMSPNCDPWIKNKTIQKAIESYRISDEMKVQLRKLR